MIYYFTPYSTEKNFAKAINDHVKIVPNDEDWICIRDGDTMFLTPEWGNIIQDAVNEYGQDYQLFGCWTNRASNKISEHQLIGPMFKEMNVQSHYALSLIQKDMSKGITPVENHVAGLFMLFQKSTWKEVNGFDEELINPSLFDKRFCEKVLHRGFKIGLINKLYIFHLYRIWSQNPSYDSKHLQK